MISYYRFNSIAFFCAFRPPTRSWHSRRAKTERYRLRLVAMRTRETQERKSRSAHRSGAKDLLTLLLHRARAMRQFDGRSATFATGITCARRARATALNLS